MRFAGKHTPFDAASSVCPQSVSGGVVDEHDGLVNRLAHELGYERVHKRSLIRRIQPDAACPWLREPVCFQGEESIRLNCLLRTGA